VFQVNFSKQSIHELNKLDKLEQMRIVDGLSNVTSEQLKSSEDIGRFSRNGKTFYRLRSGEYRIYFELQSNILYSHYILHQHTLSDFVFRFKLPVTEDILIEQHQSFWKYLESLKK